MVGSGEERREAIRPEFNRSIMIDFRGAKITSDTGFLLLQEIDDRFGILGPIGSGLGTHRRSYIFPTNTSSFWALIWSGNRKSSFMRINLIIVRLCGVHYETRRLVAVDRHHNGAGLWADNYRAG